MPLCGKAKRDSNLQEIDTSIIDPCAKILGIGVPGPETPLAFVFDKNNNDRSKPKNDNSGILTHADIAHQLSRLTP